MPMNIWLENTTLSCCKVTHINHVFYPNTDTNTDDFVGWKDRDAVFLSDAVSLSDADTNNDMSLHLYRAPPHNFSTDQSVLLNFVRTISQIWFY